MQIIWMHRDFHKYFTGYTQATLVLAENIYVMTCITLFPLNYSKIYIQVLENKPMQGSNNNLKNMVLI